MDGALYAEVVDRIRQSGTDVVINLTTGPGGRFAPTRRADHPAPAPPCARPPARAARARPRPEICSLDMGSMNLGANVFVNTPRDPRSHGDRYPRCRRDAGAGSVRGRPPAAGQRMIETGHIKAPGMFQICLGIAWGQPATPEAMSYMRTLLPAGCDLVRVRHLAAPVPDGGAGGAARRPCARRAGGQSLSRARQADAEQRRAGPKAAKIIELLGCGSRRRPRHARCSGLATQAAIRQAGGGGK